MSMWKGREKGDFEGFLTCKVKFHPFVEFNLAKSHIPKGGI